MLDLIIFALAILTTRYISQKHPLLSKDSNNNNDQPTTQSKQQYQTNNIARYIFQICLLISLLLFSLSILEVAPIAYLLIIDSSTVFILWYQALLWVQCILLVLHPIFLGVILVTSLCITSTVNTTNTSSPRSSINRATSVSDINNSTTNRQKKRSSFIIGLNILWISIRFFLVSIVWRIIRKIVGALIPYRITRANNGSGSGGGRNKQLIVVCLLLSSIYYLKSKLLQGNEEDIPYTAEEVQASSIYKYISLKYMVSILCSLGMIIASILNGFGCASLPHSNLVGLFLKPTPLSVISKVEDDLKYTMKRLEETRWMLSDVTTHQQSSSTSASTSNRPYGISKVSATDTQRIAQLQNEILFLENLVGDMSDDINEMKLSQSLALEARTSWGRVRGIVGVIFSIVLIIRVVVAANSFMVIFERKVDDEGDVKSFNSTRDPLTSLLVWLVGQNIVTSEQYDMFRQATSLILAGILSLSQVNAFFRVINALGRRLSRVCGTSFPMKKCIPFKNGGGTGQSSGVSNNNNNNNIALLLSSFIMGCYFLACVTVVKMNLPIEYRASFSNAVGNDFDFNTTLLSMIFFTSACVTAVILGSLFGIQRNNVERYQLESQLSGLSSLQAIA